MACRYIRIHIKCLQEPLYCISTFFLANKRVKENCWSVFGLELRSTTGTVARSRKSGSRLGEQAQGFGITWRWAFREKPLALHSDSSNKTDLISLVNLIILGTTTNYCYPLEILLILPSFIIGPQDPLEHTDVFNTWNFVQDSQDSIPQRHAL